MRVRAFFISVFVFIFFVIQFLIDIPLVDRILFFVNFSVLLALLLFYLLKENIYNPAIASFLVFNYLFFLIAPMVQLQGFLVSNGTHFFNGLIYSSNDFRKTNVLIIFFNFVFLLSYSVFKRRKLSADIDGQLWFDTPNLPISILIFTFISLIIFFRKLWVGVVDADSVIRTLFEGKIMNYLPLGGLIVGLYYLKNKKKSKNYYLILFFTFLLLLVQLYFQNPFVSKRNAIGPLYITLLYFLIPKILNTNFKILNFLFFSLIIIFPAISIITHYNKKYNDQSFDLENVSRQVQEQFTTLHFDAYLMAETSIDYTKKVEYSKGEQLASAFLFFVPRSVWADKPISTGELLGEHIQKHHDSSVWFHNLATPYLAEAYINFGTIGIVIFSILLAYLCNKSSQWVANKDSLKQLAGFYFSIHLIFLLRGDFTNGFVYFVVPFLSFYVFPKIILKVLK